MVGLAMFISMFFCVDQSYCQYYWWCSSNRVRRPSVWGPWNFGDPKNDSSWNSSEYHCLRITVFTVNIDYRCIFFNLPIEPYDTTIFKMLFNDILAKYIAIITPTFTHARACSLTSKTESCHVGVTGSCVRENQRT